MAGAISSNEQESCFTFMPPTHRQRNLKASSARPPAPVTLLLPPSPPHPSPSQTPPRSHFGVSPAKRPLQLGSSRSFMTVVESLVVPDSPDSIVELSDLSTGRTSTDGFEPQRPSSVTWCADIVDHPSPSKSTQLPTSSPTSDSFKMLKDSPSRNRSESINLLWQVRNALERHPSIAKNIGLQLLVPEPSPSVAPPPETVEPDHRFMQRFTKPSARAFWRHLFYVIITIALVGVTAQLMMLKLSYQQQTQVVSSFAKEIEHNKGLPLIVKKLAAPAFTVQGALILMNFVLVWRGMAIWNLIVKIKIIDTVQRLKWVDPVTRHGASVLKTVAYPIKVLFRPWARHRAKLAREAQILLARQAAEKRLWTVAARWASSVVSTWTRELGTVVFR